MSESARAPHDLGIFALDLPGIPVGSVIGLGEQYRQVWKTGQHLRRRRVSGLALIAGPQIGPSQDLSRNQGSKPKLAPRV